MSTDGGEDDPYEPVLTEPNFQRNVFMGIITYAVVNIEP
jgi:hypothetical protein